MANVSKIPSHISTIPLIFIQIFKIKMTRFVHPINKEKIAELRNLNPCNNWLSIRHHLSLIFPDLDPSS